MVREELVQEVQRFCAEHSYRYVDCITIGRCFLILILGDKCIEPFKQFLSELKGVKEYTTPGPIIESVGAYVTFY